MKKGLYLFLLCIPACFSFNWGNTLEIHNESPSSFDSITVLLGKQKHSFPGPIPSGEFASINLDLKVRSRVLPVSFTLYQNGTAKTMATDSFSCFNCDGVHQYVYNGESIQYRFQH